MFYANCRPILIGSLPVRDHEEAMRLILAHSSEIPLWPQLPKNPREGMVRQFLSGFPGLVDEDNRYWIDTSSDDFEKEMVAFYEEFMSVEEDATLLQGSRFALDRDTATGFFTLMDFLNKEDCTPLTAKGQVTGPVTTGVGLKDKQGNSVFYDTNLRDILVKLITLKARWQVSELKKRLGAMEPLVFIDEPGMVSFGSSSFGGVSKEMVSEAVGEVIKGIKTEGGLAGIHICANGDWGPALSSDTDIISFDAYFYFDNFILYKDQLTRFLSRGGILAWGIVPTGDPLVVTKESVHSLFSKWLEQLQILSSLGFGEQQLMEQTLIAPSCGTGSLSQELAEKVLVMTDELSKLARNYMEKSL